MSLQRRLLLGFLLSVVAAAGAGAQAPPPAQCVPPDALICLQVSRPQALLDLLTGPEMTRAITSRPLYQQQLSNPKFSEFVNVIKYLEATLGTDWRTGLAKLTGGGVTIALCPENTVVAIVDAQDEHMLGRLHEIFLGFARGEAEKQGHPERVASREHRGITTWTFGGEEAHAIVGKRLVLASRREGLETVLGLQAREGKGLADTPAFQAAMRANDTKAAATGFVSIKPFLGLPKIARLLDGPRKNPLASLVFAGIAESLRSSNWLSLGLDVRDKMLVVQALTDGKAAGAGSPTAFAQPQKAGDGAWPNVAVPRRIAALSLYRDLHGFYAAKDTLFPERTSGLIFFENMMGIFFTGRDLTSEVLAEAEPEIRIVVAEQEYDPAVGTPQVKIPAFAVILRLSHPEQFGKVVEEAWQKAVGLVNFTRGQQALPGLIIDRPVHGPTTVTVAAFSTVDVADKTRLDQRFNYRPTLAMPGQYLILSSTDGLARDLIDATTRQSVQATTPMVQTHSVLEIDGVQAASILRTNREALVQGDMVKKGRSRVEAETGIDLFITVVKLVDRVKLSLGTHDDLTQIRLEAALNLPKP